MANIDLVEVTPLDLTIPAESITALARVTSYGRMAPIEEFTAALPYFVVIVGTRSGFLHAIDVEPPPTALSLRQSHQRDRRKSVARDVVTGKAKRLNSTFATGITSPSSPVSTLLQRSGKKKGVSLSSTPVKASRPNTIASAASLLTKRALSSSGVLGGASSSAFGESITVNAEVSKICFSPATCRVFALCGGQIYCHSIDAASSFDFSFIGCVNAPSADASLTEPVTGCVDFALTSRVDTAVILGILTETKLVFATFEGDVSLTLNSINVSFSRLDRCAWCAHLLCVTDVEDREYRFYSATGASAIRKIPAKTSALVMAPIHDSWTYVDATQSRTHNSLMALVTSDTSDSSNASRSREQDPTTPGDSARGDDATGTEGETFPYVVQLVQVAGATANTVRTFRSLATTPPRYLSAWGPWLFLATNIGVEVYSTHSGDLIHSFLDEATALNFSLASRAAQHSSPDIEARLSSLYSTRGYEIAVSRLGPGTHQRAPFVSVVCLHSPQDVVQELLRDGSDWNASANSELAEVLFRYGHSVGVKQLIDPQAQVGNISFERINPSALGDPYEVLRLSFKTIGALPEKKTDRCAGCNDAFRFYRKAAPCATCGSHVCEKASCSTMVPLTTFQEHQSMASDGTATKHNNAKVRVCFDCLPYVDPHLATLVDRRLYVQCIRYLQSHRPDLDEDEDFIFRDDAPRSLGCAFTLRETGQIVLQRCLEDGKFTACVLMLPAVIGRSDALWKEWLERFTMSRATHILARHVVWRNLKQSVGQWLFTMLLTNLATHDPVKLLERLREWPSDIYDYNIVCAAIETALDRRRRAALDAFDRSRSNLFPEEKALKPRAIGSTYRNSKTEQLVLCLWHLHEIRGQLAEAVRFYLQYWAAYAPLPVHRTAAAGTVSKQPLHFSTLPVAASHPDPFQRILDDDLVVLLRSPGKGSDPAALVAPGTPKPGKAFTSSNQSVLPMVVQSLGLKAGDWLSRVPEIKSRPDLLQDVVTQLRALHTHNLTRRKEKEARWGFVPADEGEEVDASRVLLRLLDTLSSGSKEDVMVTSMFHALQADLYIEHEPQKLLGFLRNDYVSNVDWVRVERYARERRLYRELAYVVTRMGGGNFSEALRLILRCLRSAKYAIEYVNDVGGGQELWASLMYNVRQNEELIQEFLVHAQGHVNLSEFFRSIPSQNRLQLGPKQLQGVMINANINTALNQSSVNSIREDNLRAMGGFGSRRRQAVKFSPLTARCHLCDAELTAISADDIVIATCGHSFHPRCVAEQLRAERKPAQRPTKKKISQWERQWNHYQVCVEDGISDLNQLLPAESFTRVLAFLPPEQRHVAESVNAAWRSAATSARHVDRELTDAVWALKGSTTFANVKGPTVPIGTAIWRTAVTCPTCTA
jgi:hypothetical protein